MALSELRVLSLARPEGTRQPALPSSVRPLTPPAGRAFQVLQPQRAATQMSLFPPGPRGTR